MSVARIVKGALSLERGGCQALVAPRAWAREGEDPTCKRSAYANGYCLQHGGAGHIPGGTEKVLLRALAEVDIFLGRARPLGYTMERAAIARAVKKALA